MVTQVRPVGSTSFEEARQTGETRAVYWAGEASFSRVRSLFMVAAFQLGCVMACDTGKGLWRAEVGTSTQGWWTLRGAGQGMS